MHYRAVASSTIKTDKSYSLLHSGIKRHFRDVIKKYAGKETARELAVITLHDN